MEWTHNDKNTECECVYGGQAELLCECEGGVDSLQSEVRLCVSVCVCVSVCFGLCYSWLFSPLKSFAGMWVPVLYFITAL